MAVTPSWCSQRYTLVTCVPGFGQVNDVFDIFAPTAEAADTIRGVCQVLAHRRIIRAVRAQMERG